MNNLFNIFNKFIKNPSEEKKGKEEEDLHHDLRLKIQITPKNKLQKDMKYYYHNIVSTALSRSLRNPP